MTNKTINGVPRELIERIEYLMRLCDMDSPCIRELRALLAAPDPIVEADGVGEPVAEVEREFDFDCGHVHLMQDLPDGTKLYSADQFAALQSTIAQLKAENERLRGDAVNRLTPTYCGKTKVVLGHGWYEKCGNSIPRPGEASLRLQCKDCAKLDEVRRMNS